MDPLDELLSMLAYVGKRLFFVIVFVLAVMAICDFYEQATQINATLKNIERLLEFKNEKDSS